jgi:hypothetical protein
VKASEYGGSDTVKTQGIQPNPHEPTPDEQLRLLYATDPDDAVTGPDRDTPKKNWRKV